MANMIQNAKDSINEILNAACLKAVEQGLLPEGADLSRGSVEIPKDTTNGDYAANHAMTGAKAMRMPPRKIAEILAENACLRLKDLAVNGKDLMELGIPAGQRLGQCLNNLLEQVLDEALPNERAALLAAAKKYCK